MPVGPVVLLSPLLSSLFGTERLLTGAPKVMVTSGGLLLGVGTVQRLPPSTHSPLRSGY